MTESNEIKTESTGGKVQGMSVFARNLTCLYCNGNKKAGIEDISFAIEPGTFVGIYGKSGAGKSVLSKQLLFGRDEKASVQHGEVLLDGNAPETYVNNEVAYYPQTIALPELLTAREFLSLANADRGNREHYLLENMGEILSQCALDESILGKRIGNLSGGEKRRLGLAATLLERHLRMLIADEPTTGMDPDSEQQVMQTLRNISRNGITVLTITHSVASASLMDRILVLFKKDDCTGTRLCYDGVPPAAATLHDTFMDYINGKIENGEVQQHIAEEPVFSREKQKRENKGSLRQVIHWFRAALRLIYRDRKSLSTFVLLAVICVISIQIGVYSYRGNNSENSLLTMCSLAAPWLCAMYAAVFLAEFRQFYSWEYISGLKTHSFFFGMLLAQIFPSLLIAFIFATGLFKALNTDTLAKNVIGRAVCSEYTYDLMVRNDANMSAYLRQKGVDGQLSIVKSLYDCNQKTLLEKVLEVINSNETLTPSEHKKLADGIRMQCPGIASSEKGFIVNFTRPDSKSYLIPWFKEDGKSQLKEGYEYVDEEMVLPCNANVILEIEDKDYQKDRLKETVEYLYKYRMKELLTCLLDYVSLQNVKDWRECVKDCPGIVLDTSGEFPYYKIISWKGTPWFPNASAFWGKGRPLVKEENKLLASFINIEENQSGMRNPLMTLFRKISQGDTENYPLAVTNEAPPMTLSLFIEVLCIIWGISLIGSVIGMMGTACLGTSRDSTIFVLVLFMVFIIFSRLFITQYSHVSYLQPIAENMKAFQGIRNGDSGGLLPIAISFFCLGRYASNLIAYCVTNANLTYEYGYMAILSCLCLEISLISLRKGKFVLFKK